MREALPGYPTKTAAGTHCFLVSTDATDLDMHLATSYETVTVHVSCALCSQADVTDLMCR